jgi:enolase
MKIKRISAKAIFDSRKEKTILVEVNGCKTSAPSGKSTGKYEKKPYFNNLEEDINFINQFKIIEQIRDFSDLIKIERQLKDKIGANTLFALESSILKALALSQKKELWQILNPKLILKKAKFPRIISNTIGGGAHSVGIKSDFQEFLVTCNVNPKKANEINRKANENAFQILTNLENRKIEGNDEGAWQSSLSNKQTLEVVKELQENIFDEIKMHIDLGIDVAASQFYKEKKYCYQNPESIKSREEQIKEIINLAKNYNLFYIEDPLEEEDFLGFSEILKKTKCLIVGDDLTVTNFERVSKAIDMKAINAVIIKPNQTGSLIEVKKVIELCKKKKIFTIMSHRSGETLDDTIADLAFAFQCDFIKIPVVGIERAVKVRRLIEIEESFDKTIEK